MSLIESFSTAAIAPERRDEPSQRVSVMVTAIVAIGIWAVTLGWLVLVVRGTVSLIRG